MGFDDDDVRRLRLAPGCDHVTAANCGHSVPRQFSRVGGDCTPAGSCRARLGSSDRSPVSSSGTTCDPRQHAGRPADRCPGGRHRLGQFEPMTAEVIRTALQQLPPGRVRPSAPATIGRSRWKSWSAGARAGRQDRLPPESHRNEIGVGLAVPVRLRLRACPEPRAFSPTQSAITCCSRRDSSRRLRARAALRPSNSQNVLRENIRQSPVKPVGDQRLSGRATGSFPPCPASLLISASFLRGLSWRPHPTG